MNIFKTFNQLQLTIKGYKILNTLYW